MNNRLKTILIIILIMAVIALAVFAYLLINRNNQQNQVILPDNQNDNQTSTLTPEISEQETEISEEPEVIQQVQSELTQEEKEKMQLTKMAMAFTERFGSYSNQSNYENIVDLTNFMTNDFKAWADNYVASQRNKNSEPAIYYGITTKALSADLEEYNTVIGEAVFSISVQKQEIMGSSLNSNVFYTKAELKMVRQGGIWKVDSLYWQ